METPYTNHSVNTSVWICSKFISLRSNIPSIIVRNFVKGERQISDETTNVVFLIQPGEDLFPTDEKGKTLLDTANMTATWEVSIEEETIQTSEKTTVRSCI